MIDRPALTQTQVDAVAGARRALKESVLNVERLVEQGERILRRAQDRLSAFDLEYPEIADQEEGHISEEG